jgi:hypothetical protein
MARETGVIGLTLFGLLQMHVIILGLDTVSTRGCEDAYRMQSTSGCDSP